MTARSTIKTLSSIVLIHCCCRSVPQSSRRRMRSASEGAAHKAWCDPFVGTSLLTFTYYIHITHRECPCASDCYWDQVEDIVEAQTNGMRIAQLEDAHPELYASIRKCESAIYRAIMDLPTNVKPVKGSMKPYFDKLRADVSAGCSGTRRRSVILTKPTVIV